KKVKTDEESRTRSGDVGVSRRPIGGGTSRGADGDARPRRGDARTLPGRAPRGPGIRGILALDARRGGADARRPRVRGPGAARAEAAEGDRRPASLRARARTGARGRPGSVAGHARHPGEPEPPWTRPRVREPLQAPGGR